MVCYISCSISAIFIIGMIYFYNATHNDPVILNYKSQLSPKQRPIYDNIVAERQRISIQGYSLGAFLSLLLIISNSQYKIFKAPYSSVCLVLMISFFTNYFYYMLSPKTDWMLNHMESSAQAQAWVKMYRTMQYNYHAGLVLGILGVGVLAYAFKC
jgi:hypothetical protein